MADYWKSLPRKFCEFCKCWIADNKPSRDFHERGKNHQENVKKKIDDVLKKGREKEQKDNDMQNTMQQIEKAAMKALKKDLTRDPSMASRYGVKFKEKEGPEQSSSTCKQSSNTSKQSSNTSKRSSNTSKQSIKKTDASQSSTAEPDTTCTAPLRAWKEEWTPEGFVYYWNTVTGDRSWTKPEGYIPTWERAVKEQEETDDLELEELIPETESTDQLSQHDSVLEEVPSSHTEQLDKLESHSSSKNSASSSREPSSSSSVVNTKSHTSGGWKKEKTAGGLPYYWNTVTAETAWKKPAGFVSSDQPEEDKVEEAGDTADSNSSEDHRPTTSDDRSSDENTSEDSTAKPPADFEQMVPEIPDISQIPLPGAEVTPPPPATEPHPSTITTESPPVTEPHPSTITTESPPVTEPHPNTITTESPPVTEEEEEAEEDREDPSSQESDPEERRGSKRLPAPSVYGVWLSAEPVITSPPVDLQLPVAQTTNVEVKTIPLSKPPKINFREKKVDTLGAEFVAFKKRKMNNKKDNMRKTNTEKQ